MKKIDIVLALITGEGVAWLFLWIIKNSRETDLFFLYWSLPIFFPFLAVFGIWLSYLIGKKFLFVYQLAKFFLIGACFAVFDLIIFNILLRYFGILKEETLKYAIFVAISFIVTSSIKYFFDKYWAFEKTSREEMGMEFTKFLVITLISGGIQVGVASLMFTFLPSLFKISELVYENIGKIGGIMVASVWNFLGYKFFVFKK